MFGVAVLASAACALVCAAQTAVTSPDAGTPDTAEPGLIFFSLPPYALTGEAFTGRTALQDLTGAGWTSAQWSGATLLLGARSRLSAAFAPAEMAQPSFHALPGDALRLSNPALAAGMDRPSLRMAVETTAFAGQASGLDFEMGPRGGFSSGPAGSAFSAGLFARLGELDRNRPRRNGWHLFAGAGAEAVTVDPRNPSLARMERKAILGAAQAGLAFDMGNASLALAYTQRERALVQHDWVESRHDGFAVISFNILH